ALMSSRRWRACCTSLSWKRPSVRQAQRMLSFGSISLLTIWAVSDRTSLMRSFSVGTGWTFIFMGDLLRGADAACVYVGFILTRTSRSRPAAKARWDAGLLRPAASVAAVLRADE